MKEWLYGRNAIYEAVRARRRQFFRLKIAQGIEEKGHLIETLKMMAEFRLPVDRVPRSSLDALSDGHQGIALEASSYPYTDLADILSVSARRNEPAFILILDIIQDPQNLGTLIRTAEGVGVHGILLPFRHTASVTPAVVNASSGACEHQMIAQVNLAQAIQQLKDQNIWIIGLEAGEEALPLHKVRLDGPLALVIGGEAGGMRSLVKRSCDVLMKLPMRGSVDSLNAAVAGSVALYLVWQKRGFSSNSIDDLIKP